jgi:UV DNA damage endonuclease
MTSSAGTHPRLGFCCKFVPPAGDKAELKRMNLTSTTIAALGRRDRTEAFEKLLGIVRHNMGALEAQLRWVAGRPPLERLFRMVSGVLPGYTHASVRPLYAEPLMRATVERGLARAGAVAREGGVRLSMHPGQFCILATLSEGALRNAVDELEYHAEVMGLMGFAGGWHPAGAHVNVHGGAKAAGVEGFRRGLARLSADARGLVTVENDEDAYGLEDLLPLADELPIVLDLHHHWIRSGGEHIRPDDARVAAVVASWRGVRPVAHISAPREELVAPHPADELPDFEALLARGISRRDLYAHSDTMWNDAVNGWVAEHLAWADMEVEAKLKNIASVRLAGHVNRAWGALPLAG